MTEAYLPVYAKDDPLSPPQNVQDFKTYPLYPPSFPHSQDVPWQHEPLQNGYHEPPLTRHPEQGGRDLSRLPSVERARNQRHVDTFSDFWRALLHQDTQTIVYMVNNGIISPSATGREGETPLAVAIAEGHIIVVRQLVALGADVNQFTAVYHDTTPNQSTRTPLQIAAHGGRLTIVKFLMEETGADDSLVAPDGQIALRLAADAGHREIVKYLPARRGGGMRRWKLANRAAMEKVKGAAVELGRAIKVVLVEWPYFFLICLPCEICRLAWHCRGLPRRAIMHLLRCSSRIPRALWRGANKLPKALASLAGWLWRKLKSVPERLARAWCIVRAWIMGTVGRIQQVVVAVIKRLFSALHTAIYAMVTLFKDATLRDVWNVFRHLAITVFVNLPAAVFKGITDLSETTYRILKTILGTLGKVVYIVCHGILCFLWYALSEIPRQMGTMLKYLWLSTARCLREGMIWLDPKWT